MLLVQNNQFTEFELAALLLFVASLSANIAIFQQLRGSYSIRYELMRSRPLRRWKGLRKLILAFYWLNLLLPSVLLAAMFIEILTRGLIANAFVVLSNGLLLLSVSNFTNEQTFYYKLLAVLVTVVASQLTVMFLMKFDRQYFYVCTSCVFFSLNGVLMSLTVWAREQTYWQLSMVFGRMKDKIKEVNKLWIGDQEVSPPIDPQPPKMFDGGLYGWMSRTPSQVTSYLLYSASVAVLAVYSYLIWWERKNFLGAIAAGAILTYDVIVFFMSSLNEKTREPRTINFMIFLMRFFLFVFGEDFWFGGYCVLYVLVGGFIGTLIIEKRFPKSHNRQKTQTVNALKTPEFMLVVMTLEMVGMILGLYFSDRSLTSDFIEIGQTRWPFWLFGIVAIITNFVVFFYMASLRILFRQVNKIKDTVTYYFGAEFLTEYHIFVLITYSLLVLLGVYFYFGLQSMLGLLIFVFVPPVYMAIAGMAVCWQKNDFYILCDIDQYNKNMRKQYEAEQNTKRLLEEQKQQKRKGKKRHSAAKQTLLRMFETKAQQSRYRLVDDKLDENSEHHLLALEEEKTESNKSVRQPNTAEIYPMDVTANTGFIQLKNWRNPQHEIGFPQLLAYTTLNDRLLLFYMLMFLLLLAGFSVATKLLADSWLGLYVCICLLSYIFQMSYYRCCKTHHEIEPQEVVGIVGGFLLGLVYWAINWKAPEGAITWAVVMILLLANLLVQTLQKKLAKLLYALQITQILLCLIFICIVVNFNLPLAYLAVAGALIFYFVVGVAAYYIYKNNNDSAPKWLVYAIVGIVFLSVASVMVVGFLSDIVSDIIGFTVTMLTFSGIGLALSSYQFYSRLANRYEVPVVYSAYGLPAYKFDSTTETLKKVEAYVYVHFVSLIWIVVYSQMMFLFFSYLHVGIIALCVFEVIGYYSVGQMVTSNYHTIGKWKQRLEDNPRICQDTFDLVKNKFMLEETQGKSSGDLLEEIKQLERRLENDTSDELYDEILHLHDRMRIDRDQEERFLFFWMVLIEFRLYSDQKNDMLKVIYMVKQIQEQLEAAGIMFTSLGQEGNLEMRYDRLKSEIDSLPPEKYIYYEHLVEKQWEKKKAKDEADKILQQQEQEENRRKEEQLQKKMAELTADSQSQKSKIQQFKQLLKAVRKGRYEDPDFPEDFDLYDHLQSFGDRKKLIKGDITISDVKQGALGDCYLISALGVLGHNWVCRALGMEYDLNDKKYPQEWENCKGAFMVRFWKFSQEIYVIIDDRLPVDGSNNLIFGRSEDQDQIWVCVIEKAYAKLYGGYNMIKGGKCHLAMSELTGGFPTEIILKEYERNLNGAWNQLISAFNNQYLLAAGSPGGRGKDTTSSKRGIVQGHAYSIVEVRQIEDNRLLKLKNPHGSAGKQWRGDWSDDSPQMTNRMMGLLGHTKSNDGMFWMALQDFIIEFKSLYICRIFSENWKYISLKGEWNEQNAFGRPTLKNIELNPQFGIKIYSKSTVFISLTQQRQDLVQGINFIGLRVQRNEGKRMYSSDISTDKLCSPSRPTINSIVVSAQLNLEADSYPYIFTLMIYTQEKGEVGPYTVQFYSNDTSTEVIDDKDFNRP